MQHRFVDGIHTIEIEQQCPQCGGTGLYIGMAEKDGFSVQCHGCKGTGKSIFKHSWSEFKGRVENESAKFVIAVNPGICVGLGNGEYEPEYFGGIPYEDWKNGAEIPEMRNCTCPAWWYQLADYEKKPDWDICCSFGTFSSCANYENKVECWKRWDIECNNEQTNKGEKT